MSTQHLFSRRFFSLKSFIPLLLCLAVCSLTSCEKRRVIVNAVEEKEANEIVVFLAAKGIDATKITQAATGGGGGGGPQLYDIAVSADEATEAMAILNMNGLPRRRGQNLLGLFQTGGLVPSEMEEKIRFQAGLAEQIASTIRKIDGVLDADIQISFPEEDPLNPGKKKGHVTASVYVKHQGVLDDPNTHLITKIKRLVASSIIDLDYDNVTVISDRARFSDISLSQRPASLLDEDKQFARVWTVVVAKESISRFRTIFFSFSILVLLMGLAMVWLLWKMYPLLMSKGGITKLFELSPLTEEAKKKKPKKEQKEPSKEEGEEKKEEDEEEETEEEEGEEEEEESPDTKEVT